MEEVYFGEDGELVANYDIVNLVTFPNESAVRVKVGNLETQAAGGLELTLQQESIEWPSGFNQVGELVLFEKQILKMCFLAHKEICC